MEVEFSFGHIQLEMPMRFNRHLDIYIRSFEDRAGLGINIWGSPASKLSLKHGND